MHIYTERNWLSWAINKAKNTTAENILFTRLKQVQKPTLRLTAADAGQRMEEVRNYAKIPKEENPLKYYPRIQQGMVLDF